MSQSTAARAARAEKKAEDNVKAAEIVWRKAWWTTTLELAKPDDSSKKEIGEMYDEVERILHQRRDYISNRRRTGRAFIVLAHDEVVTLPPRKCVAVKEAGIPVTSEIIEVIRASEEANESLREFSARLTGKHWSVGSDEEIEKALETKPALAARVAAKAIKTDEGRKAVAEALVEDPKALTEVRKAEVKAFTASSGAKSAAQTTAARAAKNTREEQEMLASGQMALSALFPLLMASTEVKEFLETAEKVDYRADDETKTALKRFAERFRNFATILDEIADGSVSSVISDEDLEVLLRAS